MDPNQTAGTTPSRVNDIDLIGSDSGTEVTPTGSTGANDATGTTQMQQIPLIATSSQDRSLPINQTSIPERVGARVWNHSGDRQSADDLTRSQSRPISPTPLTQTREEMTELRGMLSSLIGEIQQRAANIRERNQTPLDPLRATSNPQSTSLFGTPEIPSARSGRYTGENSQRPPPQGMTHRSLSYSGLDEIDTGLQRPRSTLIQFQNGSRERQGEPRTRIPPSNHSIPKNRTPSAARTFHQVGFDNSTEQARRHDLRGQHSYAINNSPQKSSTYDLNKYCAFHDRKGHSTEECRAALRSQNENKKTTEETREEEEESVTPKSNRKTKVSTNKRGRETEQESPSSPPPAPKKRVDMISWGPNTNATDGIRSQTEGKIRFEITVAIRTLENPDEAYPPPSIAQYNPNMKPPCGKIPNFKRKNKITKIRELLEKPIALQIQKKR
ncbi:hypothetical protein F2Q68_00043214 [Brassica cretica]|uniref:Uncharacterized protein n=2 Tax=Brassica cretica TaxID=69181 RepID=A0A8S9LPT5_BRACR|nr:hypothetical protein F2Q68_00043214 [Brassica cretica]